MTVALASLFDGSLLQKHFQSIDAALRETDVLGLGTSGGAGGGGKSFASKQAAAIHTVNQLNKLNVLLRAG